MKRFFKALLRLVWHVFVDLLAAIYDVHYSMYLLLDKILTPDFLRTLTEEEKRRAANKERLRRAFAEKTVYVMFSKVPHTDISDNEQGKHVKVKLKS